MFLIWSTEFLENQLNNKVLLMKSTPKLEPHATDLFLSTQTTETLTNKLLKLVTKLSETPKVYQLTLKNNQPQLLLNQTVLMLESKLDKNKETEKMPLGPLLMLNTPMELTPVKMLLILQPPSQEDHSLSNYKEELRVLLTDLSK